MDSNLQLLLNIYSGPQGNCLWFIDEAAGDLLPQLSAKKDSNFIQTNRYDIFQQAQKLGLNCEFSDLDFSQFEQVKFQHAFVRLSKEKPVVHRAINKSFSLLQQQGKLHLAGGKNEGIKSYCEKTSSLFGSKVKPLKSGNAYTASFIKQDMQSSTTFFLDDSSYSGFQEIVPVNNQTTVSKPGLFGWNKIDKGSELLIETMTGSFNSLGQKRVIDLGCGYGYLSLRLLPLSPKKIILTDNNAAALLCAEHNMSSHCSEKTEKVFEVIAANAGDEIKEKVDLIICNPPFHQGFAVSGDLTELFLKSSRRLLTKDGEAWFVVNSFIPLEQKAKQYFQQIEIKAKTSQFKVVSLS